MPLTVPSITFQSAEKIGDYLTRDQVTRLIDDLQRSHKEEVNNALKPVQAEVTRLEAAHKDAEKKAAKADEYQRSLSDLQGQVERRDVAAELLGLTDPTEIGDLHSLYSSRVAGQEKPPAFREWVDAGLKAPDTVPALARSIFEAAVKAREKDGSQTTQQQGQTQQQPRTQVQTGGGRKPTGGPTGSPLSAAEISRLRPGSPEWKQAYA
jgi:hypothetical protein